MVYLSLVSSKHVFVYHFVLEAPYVEDRRSTNILYYYYCCYLVCCPAHPPLTSAIGLDAE